MEPPVEPPAELVELPSEVPEVLLVETSPEEVGSRIIEVLSPEVPELDSGDVSVAVSE